MAIQLIENVPGQKIIMGPFLDDTDGKTAETGLTIANTDIKLWKNGATALVNKDSGGATHMANGVYYMTLNENDTSSPGPLVIFVHKSGALPVRVECNVREYVQYSKERRFWDYFTFIQAKGTPTTTTLPFDVYIPSPSPLFTPSAVDGDYVGMVVSKYIVSSGPFMGGFCTRVTAYNGATQTLTVDPPFPVAPLDGDAFTMMPAAPGSLATSTVSAMQSGLATAAALTTVAGYVDTEVAAILAAATAIKTKTDNLPASPAAVGSAMTLGSGAITSATFAAGAINAAVIATGAIDADALAADAIDEIIDEVIEGSTTLRQALRLILAVAAGKSAGGGSSPVTFRDMADSKNRISATVDANGNRTAVTRDSS